MSLREGLVVLIPREKVSSGPLCRMYSPGHRGVESSRISAHLLSLANGGIEGPSEFHRWQATYHDGMEPAMGSGVRWPRVPFPSLPATRWIICFSQQYSGVDGALLRGGHEGWMNSGCKALSSAQALSKLAIISAGNGGSQGSHYHPASCGALNRAEKAKIALPSKVRKTLPKGTLASDATTLAPWMNRLGASARGHHLSHEDKPGKEKHPRAACLQSSHPESKYTFSIFKMHENTVFVDTVSSIETLCKRHISITVVPFCAHRLLLSQNIIFPHSPCF